MDFSFHPHLTKDGVFNAVEEQLRSQDLKITATDNSRPWGGFFVIDEQEAEKFIHIYFPQLDRKDILLGNKISPKILIVAPEKRLSWQYHHRRAETWKLIGGKVAVVRSDTDEEKEPCFLHPGETVQLKQGERHRLVGLHGWGIVAEIWQHTDAQHPSDEEDIVRVQDDFGR